MEITFSQLQDLIANRTGSNVNSLAVIEAIENSFSNNEPVYLTIDEKPVALLELSLTIKPI